MKIIKTYRGDKDPKQIDVKQAWKIVGKRTFNLIAIVISIACFDVSPMAFLTASKRTYLWGRSLHDLYWAYRQRPT